MSTINSKNVQVGTSGTASQNFTLYQPASPDGTVRLGVGNSGATSADVITATSAGNVGVGTSSPATKLDVNGDVTQRNGSGTIIGTISNNVGWYDFGGSGNVNGAQMSHVNTLRFLTASTERMRVDNSGNVGIGTSSPSSWGKFVSSGTSPQVVAAGSSGAGGQVSVFSNGATTSPLQIGQGYVTASDGVAYISQQANQPLIFRTNATEVMRIDSSGNVGIGTSSPSRKFEVHGAPSSVGGSGSGVLASFVNNSTAFNASPTAAVSLWNRINSGGSTFPSAVIQAGKENATDGNYAGYLSLQTTDSAGVSTERARIDSSGGLRVGITTNIFNGPSTEKLTVRNTSNGCAANLEAANVAGGFPILYLSSTHADGATQNAVLFVRSTVTVGSITTTTTSTQYNTSSDYRLKHDIAPMTGALAKVAALKPVTYKWNADESDGEGFIAHELAEVVPQCVTGEKDAVDADGNPVYQGIDTSFLVATLTAAIQELTAKVAALEAKLGAQA